MRSTKLTPLMVAKSAKAARVVGVTLAVIAAATLLPTGCSSSGPGCTSPSVTLQNVKLADVAAAFNASAIVKTNAAGGKPLAGVPVQFLAWGTSPGQSSSVGVPLGTVTTDSSGGATLHMPPIVQDNEISKLSGIAGMTFAKVSVDIPGRTVGDVAYCEGRGSARVTCGSAEQTCPLVSDRP